MLAHRMRRRANIKPALVQSIVFAGVGLNSDHLPPLTIARGVHLPPPSSGWTLPTGHDDIRSMTVLKEACIVCCIVY